MTDSNPPAATADPPTGQRLVPITERVSYLPGDPSTDRPVLGVVRGDRYTLLVDAGNSPAHAARLLGELRAAGIDNVRYVALTHYHWDHVFGIDTLRREGIVSLAERRTARRLEPFTTYDWDDDALDARVAAGLELPFCRDMIKAEMPNRDDLVVHNAEIVFRNRVTLDLGGVSVQIEHVGGSHADDSCVVYVPEQKVLFLGDCLYGDIEGEYSYDTETFAELVDALRRYDAEWFVSGHDDGPESRDSLARTLGALQAVAQTVARYQFDTEAVIAALQDGYEMVMGEDGLELIAAFQAGIRKRRGEASPPRQ